MFHVKILLWGILCFYIRHVRYSTLRFFRSAKLRSQITVVLIFSALLMTVYTSLSSYEMASREFRKMSLKLTGNISDMTASSLQEYFSLIELHTTEVITDPALRQLARQVSSSSSGSLSGYRAAAVLSLRGKVSEALQEDIRFERVDIHLTGGISFSSLLESTISPDYEACLSDLLGDGFVNESGYVGTQWGVTRTSEDMPILTCVRFLYDDLARKIGIAIFQIDGKEIISLYTNLHGAYLASRSGMILTGKTGDKITNEEVLSVITRSARQSSVLAGNALSGALITLSPIVGSSIWLVVPIEAYQDIMRAQMGDYTRSILITLAFGTLFSVLMAYYFSRNLSRSVTELTDFISNTSEITKTRARYPVSGDNEIAQIGHAVNDMLDKLDDAQKIHEKDIDAQRTLELNLLRSQINPHLLYNSLNSALWAIQKDQGTEAAALLTDMSEYYKLALSGGHQIITLEEELKLIGHYLRIQKLARHRTVNLELEIPAEFYSHPILKLTLQPIVENAVIHGFDGYRTDGTITIRAAREGDYLRITVLDNGIGIDPEELERLRTSLQSNPSENTGRSFGLYWINRSLRQTGDETCGLSIESEVSEYTLITVTMRYTGQEETADV